MRAAYLTLVALCVAVGLAQGAHAQSASCPPGSTNIDYCQIAPSACTAGRGVTMLGTLGDDFQIGSRCGGDQRGGAGNDTQWGLAGDDKQNGGSGNDTMDGGVGNDRQVAARGNDLMFGRGGKDSLDGGPGIDVIDGGSGNDTLTGGSGRDKLMGGSGNDVINARDHTADVIKCGGGRDKVVADKTDVVARDCEKVSRRK
jgi:Ca2+-binding RTX toxin-like protein